MTLRSIAGLLLGLLLQISLVVPAGACVSPERCETQASSCSCCEGKTNCPCASNSKGDEEPPGPVAPPPRPLKVDAVVPLGVIRMLEIAGILEGRVLLPDLSQLAVVGYSGVGLPVSFCRLVI